VNGNAGAAIDDRLRHELLCRLVFLRQTIDGRLVVGGLLRVTGVRIVTGAAREVRRHQMIGAGQRAEGDAVSVDVEIAPPLPAELIELLGVEHLAAAIRFGRIDEGIRHPVVHAQVEVGEDEDRRLEHLRQIEGLAGEVETLSDRGRDECNMLRIAMRKIVHLENIALRGAGRQSGRRTDALDVPDHARQLGEVA
jgi:hypothetical protein